MASILGIDIGLKRVGVAIADEAVRIALPVSIVDKKGAEAAILSIISERNVSTVVFGLPLNDDNTEGGLCAMVRKFAKRISKRASVKVAFVDEYGSSAEAHEVMGSGPGIRIDHAAAVVILERFLKQAYEF